MDAQKNLVALVAAVIIPLHSEVRMQALLIPRNVRLTCFRS